MAPTVRPIRACCGAGTRQSTTRLSGLESCSVLQVPRFERDTRQGGELRGARQAHPRRENPLQRPSRSARLRRREVPQQLRHGRRRALGRQARVHRARGLRRRQGLLLPGLPRKESLSRELRPQLPRASSGGDGTFKLRLGSQSGGRGLSSSVRTWHGKETSDLEPRRGLPSPPPAASIAEARWEPGPSTSHYATSRGSCHSPRTCRPTPSPGCPP